MKNDVNGRSACAGGQENHETFRHGARQFVQYDYRKLDGKLFSCCESCLSAARARRDEWLKAN